MAGSRLHSIRRSGAAFWLNQRRIRLEAARGARAGMPIRAVPHVRDKLIALSYDDGPSPANTEAIVEILGDHDAKATFFVTGAQIEGHEAIVRRVVEAGHEVGNHSFSHANPNDLDEVSLAREIERGSAAIAGVAPAPRLYRPPYGKKPTECAHLCAASGSSVVLWSIDSGDTQGFSSDRIVREVAGGIRAGDIVLMHDGGARRESTLTATREIVALLGRQGYRFVTVSELLASDRRP